MVAVQLVEVITVDGMTEVPEVGRHIQKGYGFLRSSSSLRVVRSMRIFSALYFIPDAHDVFC